MRNNSKGLHYISPKPPCSRYPKVGSLFYSRYRILKWLGRGGFGRVCEARDIVENRLVAIKFFSEDCPENSIDWKRFRHEGSLLQTLQERWLQWKEQCQKSCSLMHDFDKCTHHYPFPIVFDEGTYIHKPANKNDSGQRPYFVMELLDAYGKNGLPREDEQVANFVLKLCYATSFLHSVGIVHRDIKESNVMCRNGSPVLIDFGIVHERSRCAYKFAEVVTMHNSRVYGSIGTTDPHAAFSKTIGPTADIYSMGMLIRSCFRGRAPVQWMRIIEKCTQYNPALRYQTMTELIRAIVFRKHCSELEILDASSRIEQRKFNEQQEATAKLVSNVDWRRWENREEVKITNSTKNLPITVVKLQHRSWIVNDPVRLNKSAVLLFQGPGLVRIDLSGVKGVTVILRDGATLHNTTKVKPPKEDCVYHIESGCYLNFVNLKRSDHGKGRQRVFTSFKGASFVMYGGPLAINDIRALAAATLPKLDFAFLPVY